MNVCLDVDTERVIELFTHAIVEMAGRFRKPCYTLRFIEYMDVGSTNGWQLKDVVPADEIVRRVSSRWPLEPVEPRYPGEVATRYRYRDGAGEIGLVASISRPFCGDCTRARLTAAGTQIKSLEGTLELFYADNGFFPTTEQGLPALVQEPAQDPRPRSYQPGGYLRGGQVPKDPWGEDYQYRSPGQFNPDSFDLWSYGADRKPGGDGTDRDIGNWREETSSS